MLTQSTTPRRSFLNLTPPTPHSGSASIAAALRVKLGSGDSPLA